MKYVLDTNACIQFLNKRNSEVQRHRQPGRYRHLPDCQGRVVLWRLQKRTPG
jgi:hypothetical protein